MKVLHCYGDSFPKFTKGQPEKKPSACHRVASLNKNRGVFVLPRKTACKPPQNAEKNIFERKGLLMGFRDVGYKSMYRCTR